jgi:hypothetical protein
MSKKSILPVCALLFLSLSTLRAGEPQAPSKETQEEQEFEMTVPEGTVIPIVLTSVLNSKSSKVGDVFYADTNYPIWIQQRLVIPRGSIIRGTVTDVVRPGKIKGKGRIAVRFDDILLPNGVKREMIANFRGIHTSGDESFDRKSETVSSAGSGGQDAGTIVGTTTSGAIVGGLIDRGTGAAIGAGVGAAAGLATMLFTRGRDLVIEQGTQFDLELQKPMKFAYNELEFNSAQMDNGRREIRTKRVTPKQNGPFRRISPFPGIGFPY